MADPNDSRPAEQVSIREFLDTYRDLLRMELVAGEAGLDKVISEKSINRPALALTGFFKEFAHRRLQVLGAGEMAYLQDQTPEVRAQRLDAVLRHDIPAVVVTGGRDPDGQLARMADAYAVPLLRTQMKSKDFSAEATVLLEEKFAPRTSIHGTLVDVKGVGVLLRGSSGVGKSECALALVERGHSLVADDYVRVTLVGDRDLVGTSKELNRGYMECRGIGIINVASIFGVRSVRREKRIDLVITFKLWQPGMDEERTGLDTESFAILDRKLPHMTLPVRPGRDMARLAEVAAMVQALRGMGHDSAREFSERLIQHMQQQADGQA
jgi:HPr kinase/phosphorylase